MRPKQGADQRRQSLNKRPEQERERLAALARVGSPEHRSDPVLGLLADDVRRTLGVDLSTVSLVFSETQRFEAWSGTLPDEISGPGEVPRARSLCRHVVEHEAPLVVEDLARSEEFGGRMFRFPREHRFYAGTPLLTPDGHAVGTLCVLNGEPKKLGEDGELLLATFARAVVGRLETLGALAREAAAVEEARRSAVLQRALSAFPSIVALVDPDGTLVEVGGASEEILGYEPRELVGRSCGELLHQEDTSFAEELLGARPGDGVGAFEKRFSRKDGGTVWLEWTVEPTRHRGGGVYCVVRDVTVRRHREVEQTKHRSRLEEERVFLRAMMESTANGIVACDAGGDPVLHNGAARRLLGLPEGELPPLERWSDRSVLCHGDGRTPLLVDEMPLRRAYRGEVVRDQEVVISAGGGEARFVMSNARPIIGARGEVLGAIEVMQDVTQRRNATEEVRRLNETLEARVAERTAQHRAAISRLEENERRLRESEERYALVVEGSNDGIWDWNLRTGEIYWNDRLFEIVGLSRLDLPPSVEGFMGLVHPHDVEDLGDHLKGYFEQDGVLVAEFRLRHSSGEYRDCVLRGKAQRDEHGLAFRVAGSIRDVTESRKSGAALKESEERFRALVQHSSDIIVVLEADGTIRYASPSVERVLGFLPEELAGRSVFDRVHPKDAKRVLGTFGENLRKPGAHEPVGFRVRHADGTWCHVEAVGGNLLDRPEVRGIVVNCRNVTERVKAEASLRDAEERFRTLAENIPVVTYISALDHVSTSLYMSPRLEDLLGYSSEERLADPELWVKRLHAEDRERVLTENDRSNRTGEPLFMEYRMTRRDGRVAWVRDESFVLRDGEGRPYRRQGYLLDVTEHRRAEEELERQRAFLRRVIDTNPNLVFVKDWDGRFTLANRAVADIYGTTAEELVGRSDADFNADRDELKAFLRADREVMQTLQSKSISEEAVTDASTGERRWFQTVKVPLAPSSDEPRRVLGVSTEITTRKRTEEALKESEERYRSLFHQNPDPVYSLDPAGRFISANPATEALIGRGLDGLLDFQSESFISKEDRKIARHHFSKTLAGEPQRFEISIAHPNGRPIDLSVKQVPIVVDGRVVGVYGIAKDITARRKAEAEVRKLNESLETSVEERTAQLRDTVEELERTGKQLVRAKEEAEAANKAKSDFLANMSHEIRTPMNGVIGMIEILLGSGLRGDQREYAETVRSSGKNLLEIIDDILDFSKIEAGKLRLETIDFDQRIMLDDLTRLNTGRAREKGLKLTSRTDPAVPRVLGGDPGRLRQVLANLVGNAVKFTESGEVVLSVDVAEETADEIQVCFSVSDTGIGLTEEQRNRLFTSFSQADASTTRKYGGTGLGLAICRQLVELMGGEIGAESEPGIGSTFWFKVPLLRRTGDLLRSPGPGTGLRGSRILVVAEGDEGRCLREELSSRDIHIEGLRDSSRTLDALRSAADKGSPHDLVVLDTLTGGIELTREIKADPVLSATRVVLLTSLGRRGDGALAEEAGATAYLTKPVERPELLECLAAAMHAPGSADDRERLITRYSLRERRARPDVRILVAEDKIVNQKVIAMMLKSLGYEADVVSNGSEALEALSRTGYAAVLMDVQMPIMDGYETTREIRRREGPGQHVPIVAITANAMRGDREKALAAGMDDYVAKPVEIEELDAALTRWTTGTDSAPPAAKPALPNGDATVDMSRLRAIEPSLMNVLIEAFRDEVPAQISALRGAVEAGNAREADAVAHALKGISGSMGAVAMASLCAEMHGLLDSDEGRASALVVRIEEEFGRVNAVFDSLP